MPKFSDVPLFPRLHLFSFLNTNDALSASSVDRESLEFQNTDLFWHQRVQNDFFCVVPVGINPKVYHAQRRAQEAPMLATFFKNLILSRLGFGLGQLHRCVLILNEPTEFLVQFNGLFNNIMKLYGVYNKYAGEIPALPRYPESFTAVTTAANFNQTIEIFAAKLLALPMSTKLASPEEKNDIYFNLKLPEKLPLDFLYWFAELKMWHKVRQFLSSLKQDELANVLKNHIGLELVKVCIRYGNANELRWLVENVSLKLTVNELILLIVDLWAFAHQMETGIAKIEPTRARNHVDHGVTLEQYELLTEQLQDDPATLTLLSTFSLNWTHEDVWASKKESINEYYANRIQSFHQFIHLFLQQGVDLDVGIPQEDGTIITPRDIAGQFSVAFAGLETIAQERKPMLIGVLNAIINAQLQSVQELHAEPDDDDQQSRMKNRPGAF